MATDKSAEIAQTIERLQGIQPAADVVDGDVIIANYQDMKEYRVFVDALRVLIKHISRGMYPACARAVDYHLTMSARLNGGDLDDFEPHYANLIAPALSDLAPILQAANSIITHSENLQALAPDMFKLPSID